MVIVGGGSAGCALAGPSHRGPGPPGAAARGGRGGHRRRRRSPTTSATCASLAAADPDGPHTWDVGVELTPGRWRTRVGRGRLLGGSSAVNGANHLRATRADLDAWPGWSYDETLPYYVRGEHDLDMRGPAARRRRTGAGRAPGGGAARARVTERFLDGRRPRRRALRAGQERRPAARRGPGARQRAPRRARQRGDGLRAARTSRGPNLTVRGDITVARVLLDGDRAVGVEGVEAASGSRPARSCSPPGRCAPRSCWRSRASARPTPCAPPGLPVHHERPGVGQRLLRPPERLPGLHRPPTTAPCTPRRPPPRPRCTSTRGDDPAGDLEILLFARPFAPGGAVPPHVRAAGPGEPRGR